MFKRRTPIFEPNQAAIIAAVRIVGDTVGEERKKGLSGEEAEECGGVPGMSTMVGAAVAAASNLGLLIRRVVHD